jgi:hypothetical protein
MNLSVKKIINILTVIATIGAGSIAIAPANAEVIGVTLEGEIVATKGVNVTVGESMKARAIVYTKLSDYANVSLGSGVKVVDKQIMVFAGQDPCTQYAKSKSGRLGTPKSILQIHPSDSSTYYTGKTETPILTRTTGKRVGPLTDIGTVCIMHYSYTVDAENRIKDTGSFGFTVRENIGRTNRGFNSFAESFPITLTGKVTSAESIKLDR